MPSLTPTNGPAAPRGRAAFRSLDQLTETVELPDADAAAQVAPVERKWASGPRESLAR